MNKIKKAFTLVELLVVISIIGILATLTLASFTQAQKQARDTQRKSDIKQYQTLLESYANNNGGAYPIYTRQLIPDTLCTTLGLSSCIIDPKTTSPQVYYYRYASDGTEYVLIADLEGGTYYYVCSSGRNGIYDSLVSDCPF